MIMDENDFFRQATLRICGHLEIEKGMSSCLCFLESFIPVETMFLQLYELTRGAMRVIAKATAKQGTRIDVLTPFTAEAKQSLAMRRIDLEKSLLPDVLIINHPESDPIGRTMLESVGEKLDSSLLIMSLIMDDVPLGGLVLITKGNDRYTDEHARLLSLLKDPFCIAMSNTLKHREVLDLKEMLTDDNQYLIRELLRLSGDEIIGENFGLKGIMELVRQVSPLDSPVLLLGETGVGKDVIANAIHYSSSRREGPFITVNCGAIPDTLMDSELFGYEKGAFTGALSRKRGRFERADKGTIFLDEIGELPPQAQIRLLRVVQSKEIERVGGSRPIPVDVRIIAATHRNLEEMIQSGQFREDLWFRLNVFPVIIPPLRQRKEDIPALVNYLIERKSKALKLIISPKLAVGAVERLMAYRWPGNVRELENVIERELILNRDGPLMFNQIVPTTQKAPLATGPDHENEIFNLDEVISRHIQKVLKMTSGRVHGRDGAAALMGINPSTLRNRMNKLGIPYGRQESKKGG
jgi:formate hydrogenlyase transcriptional activator